MAEGKETTGDGSQARARTRGSGRVAEARGRGRSRQPDLQKDLRDFVSARPEGWGHDDWLIFLESLHASGHDIRDREAIGRQLERERLDFALSQVKGVGPQRRAPLVEEFGTVWALRSADVDEIARVGNLPRAVAQRVKAEIR